MNLVGKAFEKYKFAREVRNLAVYKDKKHKALKFRNDEPILMKDFK